MLGLYGGLTTEAVAAWHEEERVYNDGALVLYLGWYPDPPYAGEPQYVYVLPYVDVIFDDDGIFVDGTPVVVSDNGDPDAETSPDDNVDVVAKVQLLESADPNAAVLQEAAVAGKFFELYEGYNYFALPLLPRTAGAYAFLLNGEINGVQFNDERFVCMPADQLHSLEFDGFILTTGTKYVNFTS
jgi:hypothetical protein